jgi:hypothetical protein
MQREFISIYKSVSNGLKKSPPYRVSAVIVTAIGATLLGVVIGALLGGWAAAGSIASTAYNIMAGAGFCTLAMEVLWGIAAAIGGCLAHMRKSYDSRRPF